jgi:phospholipase D1/2
MFHPSSNRLSGFLEISALSIALAQSGGAQYKAGFLRIDVAGGKGGGFGRRGASWKEKRRTKWCAVRESYLVVLEEPGEVRRTLSDPVSFLIPLLDRDLGCLPIGLRF